MFGVVVFDHTVTDGSYHWMLQFFHYAITAFSHDSAGIVTLCQAHERTAILVAFHSLDPAFIGFIGLLLHLVPQCLVVFSKQAEAIGLALRPGFVTRFVILAFLEVLVGIV